MNYILIIIFFIQNIQEKRNYYIWRKVENEMINKLIRILILIDFNKKIE